MAPGVYSQWSGRLLGTYVFRAGVRYTTYLCGYVSPEAQAAGDSLMVQYDHADIVNRTHVRATEITVVKSTIVPDADYAVSITAYHYNDAGSAAIRGTVTMLWCKVVEGEDDFSLLEACGSNGPGENVFHPFATEVVTSGGAVLVSRDATGLTVRGEENGSGVVRLKGVITSNGTWSVSMDVKTDIGAGGLQVDICDVSIERYTVGSEAFTRIAGTVTVGNHSEIYDFVDLHVVDGHRYTIANLSVKKLSAPSSYTHAPTYDINYIQLPEVLDFEALQSQCRNPQYFAAAGIPNLLPEVKTGKGWQATANGWGYYVLENPLRTENYLYSPAFASLSGKEYTIGFWYKVSPNAAGTELFILNERYADEGAMGYFSRERFVCDDVWHLFLGTLRCPATVTGDVRCRWDNNGSTDGTVSRLCIRNPFVVEGRIDAVRDLAAWQGYRYESGWEDDSSISGAWEYSITPETGTRSRTTVLRRRSIYSDGSRGEWVELSSAVETETGIRNVDSWSYDWVSGLRKAAVNYTFADGQVRTALLQEAGTVDYIFGLDADKTVLGAEGGTATVAGTSSVTRLFNSISIENVTVPITDIAGTAAGFTVDSAARTVTAASRGTQEGPERTVAIRGTAAHDGRTLTSTELVIHQGANAVVSTTIGAFRLGGDRQTVCPAVGGTSSMRMHRPVRTVTRTYTSGGVSDAEEYGTSGIVSLFLNDTLAGIELPLKAITLDATSAYYDYDVSFTNNTDTTVRRVEVIGSIEGIDGSLGWAQQVAGARTDYSVWEFNLAADAGIPSGGGNTKVNVSTARRTYLWNGVGSAQTESSDGPFVMGVSNPAFTIAPASVNAGAGVATLSAPANTGGARSATVSATFGGVTKISAPVIQDAGFTGPFSWKWVNTNPSNGVPETDGAGFYYLEFNLQLLNVPRGQAGSASQDWLGEGNSWTVLAASPQGKYDSDIYINWTPDNLVTICLEFYYMQTDNLSEKTATVTFTRSDGQTIVFHCRINRTTSGHDW